MKHLLQYGKSRLDGTNLKIIGIILMFCDHLHQMFLGFWAPTRLNMLGRPVFPMFLFMLAEGMHFTRSRKKYLLLLFAGSVVMNIGKYFFSKRLPVESIVLINNVFGTLLITGLYIVFYDLLKEGIKIKSVKKILGAIGLMLVPIIISWIFLLTMNAITSLPTWFGTTIILLMGIVPNITMIEWGFIMVIIGMLFYIFRKWRWVQVGILALFSLITFLMNNTEHGYHIQRMMIFAAIPMMLYNGKKGKGRKWLFYVFYPAHIFLLYIIAYFWSS